MKEAPAELGPWIERQFRDRERPQSIDAYPLWKKRDREVRLYHYSFLEQEEITASRSLYLANELFSDCQAHCNNLRAGDKTYEITVINDRLGGPANPVGTWLLTLAPEKEQSVNEPLLQFFTYEHLPPSLQEVSKSFCVLADVIVATLPRNPERTVALRKLLEAKDCAVRALLYKD